MTAVPPATKPPASPDDSFGCLLALVPVFLVGWAVWTLGGEIISWLRAGTWESPSIIAFLAKHDVQWAVAPEHWIGVHRLLGGCPLWMGLAVVGFALGYLLLILEPVFRLVAKKL
jgi:hypothetical protein